MTDLERCSAPLRSTAAQQKQAAIWVESSSPAPLRQLAPRPPRKFRATRVCKLDRNQVLDSTEQRGRTAFRVRLFHLCIHCDDDGWVATSNRILMLFGYS